MMRDASVSSCFRLPGGRDRPVFVFGRSPCSFFFSSTCSHSRASLNPFSASSRVGGRPPRGVLRAGKRGSRRPEHAAIRGRESRAALPTAGTASRWPGWRATCCLVESRESDVTRSVPLNLNLSCQMKLIVEPDDGIAPILTAIKQAKKTIDVLIFRLDRSDMARALEAAVARGVAVRALTAHTNRGGEKHLRRLEMHLLEAGCHRLAHGRRPGPLSRQDDDRRRPDPPRLRLQLHDARHRQEPQLRRHHAEPASGAGGAQAVRAPTSIGSPTHPASTG